jgi:hypothetical protein
MPKATAIWLIDNTSLTFEQIASFCGLHLLEVESLANGETDQHMSGFDPIVSSQLEVDEIRRCENDPAARLTLKTNAYFESESRTGKYTPKSKRHDKPDAILWLLKFYPEMPDSDICSLLGTTKATIRSIKSKTHRNSQTLKPRSPVMIGLCSEHELEIAISKLNRG